MYLLQSSGIFKFEEYYGVESFSSSVRIFVMTISHLQKLDEVQVKIHVIDKDDNNPVFVERNMTRGVRVNAPIYTEIGEVQTK